MPNSIVLLVARILMCVIFIPAGYGKLTNLAGTAQYFAGYNLPMPSVTAVIVGLIELVGGLAILLGFQTRIASYVLAVFCVATALVAHTNWADMGQMINFQKNLAMAGGFLVLAVCGAGAYSVDGRRGTVALA